jgi:hypothetical protein
MHTPRFDLRAEFLVQTPQALGGLRDGPDVCLKDHGVRRGGADDVREPPERGRAPIGPARLADILAEHAGRETARGSLQVTDRIVARSGEIAAGFIVHVRNIHGGEIA